MNKNISFFIALSFCNIAFTNEIINDSSKEIVILEDKKSIPSHNLIIKIQSKNDDSKLFNEKAEELMNIIQAVHRSQNSSNLYNQILAFIKETQEAILAGYNLITTATTATPFQLFSAVEEALTQEKTSDENQVEDNSSTKNSDAALQNEENTDSFATKDETSNASQDTVQQETITKETTAEVKAQPQAIEFSINIFLEKEEDKDLFNALVSKMDDLASLLNEGSHSAEEITALFNDVILAAHHLPNTNLTIKII